MGGRALLGSLSSGGYPLLVHYLLLDLASLCWPPTSCRGPLPLACLPEETSAEGLVVGAARGALPLACLPEETSAEGLELSPALLLSGLAATPEVPVLLAETSVPGAAFTTSLGLAPPLGPSVGRLWGLTLGHFPGHSLAFFPISLGKSSSNHAILPVLLGDGLQPSRGAIVKDWGI